MTNQSDDWWRRPLAAEPGRWSIALVDASEMSLTASGYSEESGVYVFTLLMEGKPPVEVEIARVPSHQVRSIDGG